MIQEDGFSFLSLSEGQVLYRKLTTKNLNAILWKAELGTESDRFLKRLKTYIYSQLKNEASRNIQNVGGEIIDLDVYVMENYLSKMLKFSPYIGDIGDYSYRRRNCREVDCNKKICPFQITCEKDPWFLKLAETAQEKREWQEDRYKWDQEDEDYFSCTD